MRASISVSLLTVLVACGDPSEHYRPPLAEGDGPTGEGEPLNEAPPCGDACGRLADGSCQATALTNERYGLEEGAGVMLGGDILYAGESTGLVLVDVITTNSLGGADQSAYSVVCGGVGAFEAEVPKDLGEVRLVVFLDSDGNGPSEGDPGGLSDELDVDDAAITGVTIHVTDDPDLGAYSPENQIVAPPAQPPDGEPGGEPALAGDASGPADGEAPRPADAPTPTDGPPPGPNEGATQQ